MSNILPKLDRWLSGRECPDYMAEKNFGSFLSFDKAWFGKRQNVLLWLLNKPVIKYITRWFLCIDTKEKIEAIIPNATFTKKGKNWTGDFRTHPKYAKRIYYSLFPVWWTLHFFDWLFLERYFPQYNFNCGTLAAYPDPHPETNTVDGPTGRTDVIESWSTILVGAGNRGGTTTATANHVACSNVAWSTTNNWNAIWEAIYLFDTSSLGAGETINSATLDLYVTSLTNDFSGGLAMVETTPASNTDIVNSDYANVGVTRQASDITISTITTSAYNQFTLNATGEASIAKTGISKFGSTTSHVVDNSEPTWSASKKDEVFIYFADQTGTSTDPKLVVNFGASSTFTPRLIMY